MQASSILSIGVVSDIHYAGPAEQARGNDYEYRNLKSAVLRALIRFHRHNVWLRYPLNQNYLLQQFLDAQARFDLVVANGDYSCNSGFIGLADDPAFQSARECLEKLRRAFPERFLATFGDHELGKIGLTGKQGGMMLKSFFRARDDLRLEPFWQREAGAYKIIGVASSLVALPSMEPDLMPGEKADWQNLRTEHLEQISQAFEGLDQNRKVLLFCHDPTALPYLLEIKPVREKLSQIELTVIGHLHSGLILWKSKLLAGMPKINCLGHSVRKFSSALNRARSWKTFNVVLCPSLAGIELLKDGGYLELKLDTTGSKEITIEKRKVKRSE